MPRFSSMRSGLLLTLFLVVFGYGTFAFAQMDYAAMDAAKMGGMSGVPGAKDAVGAQQGSITNVGSGVKRSGSSLGAVQALLYADACSVVRVNATKIDYESLAKTVDDFVDKAGGSVRSDDKYLVQLREYQKSSAKSSFKSFLSTVQNALVQRCFNKKIDEAYFIRYTNDKGDGCLVLALPTDGLSEADQKTAIDAICDFTAPLTVFVRFGFIVAVLKHDAVESFDIEKILDSYYAKMQQERLGSAYGSYGASNGSGNGANNGGYNSYGSRGSELGGARQGSGTPSFGATGMNMGMNDSQNVAVQNPLYPNVLGLSPKLYAEYVEEVTAAEEKVRTNSRRSVLPYVRRRFEKPATPEESTVLFDALRQADGAVVSCVGVNADALRSIVEKQKTSKDDAVSQPFSALGSDDSPKSSSVVDSFSSILNAKEKGNWKSATIALSLVGAPKLSVIATYADEDSAKTEADAVKGALALAKPVVKKALDDAASQAEKKVDFSPLIDSVFDSLQPQINGSKVAVLFDSSCVQENAGLFLSLLGGTETKSALEQESEEIDWSLGEEKEVGEVGTPAEGSKTQELGDEEDPFAEETEKPATNAAQSDATSDDDPFGSDDEDPFGE